MANTRGWKQTDLYDLFAPFLTIKSSPHDRVRKNMPKVDEDLLRVMTAVSILAGKNPTINSGHRDYYVEGSYEGSLHRQHKAVDMEWDNIPGRGKGFEASKYKKAEFICNVAHLLGIRDMFVTTKPHADGEHAHIQFTEGGLGNLKPYHSSDYIGYSRTAKRTPESAEEAIRKTLTEMGIQPEKIMDMLRDDRRGQNQTRCDQVAAVIGKLGERFQSLVGYMDTIRIQFADTLARIDRQLAPGLESTVKSPHEGPIRIEFVSDRAVKTAGSRKDLYLEARYFTGKDENLKTGNRWDKDDFMARLGKETGKPIHSIKDAEKASYAFIREMEAKDARRGLDRRPS